MKYICIDDGAVAELISGREYQSIDFEEGDRLVNALAAKVRFVAKLRNVVLIQDEEGVFLTTKGPWTRKRYLVIDCNQSALFTGLRSGETLQSFQKLLRFCSKFWSGGILNKSEKIITGTSKVVIFPLPYSTKPYRIVMEREPWKVRLHKRDMNGRFLLVYKTGWEGANSASEEADETNFRRVFKRLPNIYDSAAKADQDIKKATPSGQVRSTDLGPGVSTPRPAHLPFIEWLPHLTAKQKDFVFSDSSTPHRLQGPAGTGKTLSLILRTVRTLLDAEKSNTRCHALLITHSEATRSAIQDTLSVIDPRGFQSRSRKVDAVTLSVETLASLCADVLRQSISESEFIDRDAQDSKFLQQMYINHAIDVVKREEFPSFKPHLSRGFKTAFESMGSEELSSLFQHEISVLIKGRAGDSFDMYKNCPALEYGLPVSNDADKGLAFRVYQGYQEQLESSSQFDTDDVVISAIGQLDTPIWRRRRSRDGYDFIAVDEAHLFNINELHVFHHFTRDTGKLPITFTVDQAQGVGDRGWNDISKFSDLFGKDDSKGENSTIVTAVFRSSPQIRDFCQSILASGATLFTSFKNTLTESQSVFTAEDERKSQPIYYNEFPNDTTMIEGAFKSAEELLSKTDSRRSQVLITSLCDDVLKNLREYAGNNNKPVTYLERRGDFVKVKQAEKSGHLVLGHADFVGGLEFNVVVIVGVDKGRVPHEGESADSNSRSFASYSAHNRLYVASSRARYALTILGVKSRGVSDILQSAKANELYRVV